MNPFIRIYASLAVFLFLLSISLSCPAQKNHRLPDSIPGSTENTTVFTDTSAAGSDSVTVAGTDTTTDTTDNSRQEDTLTQHEPATFRTVPDSVMTRWKKDPDFAYANDPAYWTPEKENEQTPGFLRSLGRLLSSNGFRYFIYFLLAAILIYAIYRIIAENNLRLFYRKGTRPGVIRPGASLEEEDLDKGLEQALTAGDHRLATRYLYLKALRLLAEKELIRYHPQATNQEYINQTKELPQAQPFRFLTGAYERVWYGEFPISSAQFERLTTAFQDFYRSIRGLTTLLLLLFLLPLFSCNYGNTKKLNRRVTLWRKDKIPYGTYIAYESLPHLFPNAGITINQNSPTDIKSPANANANTDSWINKSEGKKAYVIIVHRMMPDASEVNAIMNFVGAGNHVFMSAFQFSDTLLRTLSLKPGPDLYHYQGEDSLRLSLYDPVGFDSLSFAYPGASYGNWVYSLDSQYTTILGRDAKGRPNFVKFTYKGGGTLYLQFAPMAFTNFFLLHKKNMFYYDNALSYLPASVKEVIWDDYFRYDNSSNNFSAFQYIFGNRSLRWAFWLSLLLFGIIYLFESKRKQKMVPVATGLRNNSLDFVTTIGRLYYQRRDNRNLALKMSAHFLDHIRTRYNLSVTAPNEEFVTRLSYKTGYPLGSLQELVSDINRLQAGVPLTDEELLAFQRKIDEFYKHE